MAEERKGGDVMDADDRADIESLATDGPGIRDEVLRLYLRGMFAVARDEIDRLAAEVQSLRAGRLKQAAELEAADRRISFLKQMTYSMAERIASQSELLSGRSEEPPRKYAGEPKPQS